jgi:hypothetical protein
MPLVALAVAFRGGTQGAAIDARWWPHFLEPNPTGDGETWPKATVFLGVFGGTRSDGVWPGFSVAAFKKDKQL